MKQLLKRTKGPQFTGPLKRQRSLSEVSTVSCSSISSEDTDHAVLEKRVRIYPMVQVKEITKYTEDEADELFLSHDELLKIRQRENFCVMTQSSDPTISKYATAAFSLADREDLECKTGLRSFEDMQARHLTRKAVVNAVLQEQAFNRESLGSWDAVLAPKRCKRYNMLSAVHALSKAVENENEVIEIYQEDTD